LTVDEVVDDQIKNKTAMLFLMDLVPEMPEGAIQKVHAID